MYEMRAERATAEAVLLWHAVAPGGEGVALCGCILGLATDASVRVGGGVPTDRYCSPCMAAVSETMKTGRP